MSLVHLALRARAEGLVVCTTGVMALAATTSGYTRASGSFVADGFAIGQEIVPASFATNTPRVVKAVSALTLTTTATKRDVVILRNISGGLYEVGRSMNIAA